MLKREDIDRFYKDVEGLGLKFPVAEIARATGHSKANVSKYLSRKLEPSEAFLNAFYDMVQKGGKNVSREISDQPPDLLKAFLSLTKSNEELVQAHKVIADTNLILAGRLSESAEEGSQKAFESMLPGLRELLVDLGLGTHWKSRDEGAKVVRNKLFADLREKKSERIRDGSGKEHR